MLKSRWFLIGLLLVMTACVVVTVLALLPPPTPGVTKENFDRIEAGMTRAEVEQILGGKANGFSPWSGIEPRSWEDEISGARATFGFDEQNRVARKIWVAGLPDERTPWQKLLDRLPWRAKPGPRRQIGVINMN